MDFLGAPYLDATLLESFPYRTALADGCDHVLVLRTRSLESRLGPPSFFNRRVVAPLLARHNPALREVVLSRPERYNADAETLERAMRDETATPSIYSVCPSADRPGVGRLEKDRTRLVAGAASGLIAVWEAISGDTPKTVEVLVACSDFGRPIT